MQDNGVMDRLGGREEADPHPGRENLGETVEPDDPTDFGLITVEREVRQRSRCAPKIEVVVRIICPDR